LYHLNCIYIIRDLPDADLVRVTAHELRHGWQFQNQEYWSSFKLREYDADLFSREFSSYLGHPSGNKIAMRLVTTYGMKCGELSPYVRDLILNKGDWKNGVNKYQFES
jgi:integrase